LASDEKIGTPSSAERPGALEPWRKSVLRGLLTVSAVVAPVIVASALLLSEPPGGKRTAVLISAGLAFPALRLMPGLMDVARAVLFIGAMFASGVSSLAMFGFLAGPGIVLMVAGVLAVLFLGRARAYVFIGLAVVAFVLIGALAAGGVLQIETGYLDPGRLRNWLRVAITFTFMSILLTTAIDFVIRRVEQSSRATAEALNDLRAAYERLALLHERLDAAKEEERRFMAHELHDELGQMLTVVKLRLAGVAGSNRAAGAPGADGPIAETIALVDGMIGRVRKISSDLRPPLLDEMGLFPALRAHVDAQSALSGVPIELDAEGEDGERLDAALEIACFRVVQESLTNALRHAAPRRIRVRAVRRRTSLSLSIIDDGSGFDTATLAEPAEHLGVVGMQERIRARGGTFRIDSHRGAGTTVDVELPVG
jgi:signal transduction histidine kinase